MLGVFLVVAVAVKVSFSLPVLEDNSVNKDLAEELNKLNRDGVAASKTEEHHYHVVNGHGQESYKEKETVSNPKTGELLAKEETVGSQKEGKLPHETTKIDIPVANIHEKDTLMSAEKAAKYIFDSSDYDGVQRLMDKLVQAHEVTKVAADKFMENVRDYLEEMHEKAFEQLRLELMQSHKDDEKMFQSLLVQTNKLNDDTKVLKDIQHISGRLFHKFNSDEDRYAERLLSKFAKLLHQAKESGHLDENVENDVLGSVLRGINNEISKTATTTKEL